MSTSGNSLIRLEDAWILGVLAYKTVNSPLGCRDIKPVNPKGNQPWIFIGRTDPEAEGPILWPPDAKIQHNGKDSCWERLKAKGGESRGWDGEIASPTPRTWIWAHYRRQRRTEEPGAPQTLGPQRAGHDLATEQLLITASIITEHIFVKRAIERINGWSITKDWYRSVKWSRHSR